jgi:hypothetical protein
MTLFLIRKEYSTKSWYEVVLNKTWDPNGQKEENRNFFFKTPDPLGFPRHQCVDPNTIALTSRPAHVHVHTHSGFHKQRTLY